MSTPLQTVTLTIKNHSGKDLVYAAQQGINQDGNGGQWLCQSGSNSWSWEAAPSPFTEQNAGTFLVDLPKDATLVIVMPTYTTSGGNVGFRFYVADPAYRTQSIAKGTLAAPSLLQLDFLYDKFEGGLAASAQGGDAWAIWDITAVDFVGLPMQLTKDDVTVGYKDGVTAQGLWKLLCGLGDPYNTSPNPNSVNDDTLRFFSPGYLDDSGKILDAQITTGLPTLVASDTVVNYGNYVYKNFRTTTDMSQSPVNANLSCDYSFQGGPFSAVTIAGITTQSALAGTIEQNGSAAQNNFGAIISAAICRGVLGNPEHWGSIAAGLPNCATPWNYYPAGAAFNAYSQMVHAYSIDGKNYGFPYDDYFKDEAGFNVQTGDSVTLTVLPYDGAFTAQPNAPATPHTGSLNITVPAASIYPAGSGWNIGNIKVENTLIPAGNSILCGLNSETVVCTFPGYPGVTMNIHMDATSTSSAITFTGQVGGRDVTGITGLVYDPQKRTMAFGQTANWIS